LDSWAANIVDSFSFLSRWFLIWKSYNAIVVYSNMCFRNLTLLKIMDENQSFFSFFFDGFENKLVLQPN